MGLCTIDARPLLSFHEAPKKAHKTHFSDAILTGWALKNTKYFIQTIRITVQHAICIKLTRAFDPKPLDQEPPDYARPLASDMQVTILSSLISYWLTWDPCCG